MSAVLTAMRARLGSSVIGTAAERFGLDPGVLVELDGYENLVYDAGSAIVRIGHTMRRREHQVTAELEWVDQLAAAGCPVAAPIRAVDGGRCVVVADDAGGHFVAAAFVKAPGVILDDHPDAKARWWNEDLFTRWGQAVAGIHRHGAVATKRPHWHDIDEVARIDAHLAAAPAAACVAAAAHLARLRDAPPGAGYGLVHGDPTQWNFVVDADGALTLFDFDSAMRCWYVMDVAVALYYARFSAAGDDESAFVAEFLPAFVAGYRSVRPLPAAELARLPDMLLLQTVILYALAHRDLDVTGEETAAFRDRAARRLLGAEPVVDLGSTIDLIAANDGRGQ